MLIVESRPKSAEAEAYKTLRTNVQYSSISKKIKTLLVTSADSKDGKSTVCSNLGVTFSQNGQSVIILDCDFRKPSIHKFFNISNSAGITDILLGEEKLEETIQHYNSNTDILTAGNIPPNPSEILGSQSMINLLSFLSERYDIVIIDSPPVGVVTDAQIISASVDGTLVVIRAEETKAKRVTEAVNLLKKVDANIIGMVLNEAQTINKSYSDYYV
ncbi:MULTISPECIES: CpsD/CapB family tyrosine-protein kinase [Clostridium]|uniref:CpsD/CapB family tyrosine-protein kinase n=1 Tax=Clostridium TaxID=1485 RepID=UPI0008A4934A|nr:MULTISPECIES: CpsD/CapB family tyrosine-protein kinase [Clostridium]MDU3581270.1 CpsD/CapB family tyrosine-protein kinase [Clostridium butyricum]MDU3594834.1 CpsD/CapB family tyrosine-protein kinase [Clostridium butyricum]MDU5723058.1 CpsD/CapB family tyrosine-protein kinase [Clostridium butyricum]MDU5820985.1 CpsD/CapB family tyrosine-protein kinase [Clostridium butyricum]OFS26244.1 capsular biosynthesis protein [Clostridium sp. HMSC19A10]